MQLIVCCMTAACSRPSFDRLSFKIGHAAAAGSTVHARCEGVDCPALPMRTASDPMNQHDRHAGRDLMRLVDTANTTSTSLVDAGIPSLPAIVIEHAVESASQAGSTLTFGSLLMCATPPTHACAMLCRCGKHKEEVRCCARASAAKPLPTRMHIGVENAGPHHAGGVLLGSSGSSSHIPAVSDGSNERANQTVSCMQSALPRPAASSASSSRL